MTIARFRHGLVLPAVLAFACAHHPGPVDRPQARLDPASPLEPSPRADPPPRTEPDPHTAPAPRVEPASPLDAPRRDPIRRAEQAPASQARQVHRPPLVAESPPFPLRGLDGHVEPDLVGVIHVVKKGETIYRIAKTYGIPAVELMQVNDLRDPRQMDTGSEIFIPGALKVLDVPSLTGGVTEQTEVVPPEPVAPPPKVRALDLRWPIRGVLYSRFGVRQGQRHDGVDISAPKGTPIVAAAAGAVVFAGRQSGYGAIVILRHDRGFLTLYAHASALLVQKGDQVEAGQPIARVGRSGKTTGPHLHFEVREGTRPRNPLFYLP